MTTPKSEKLYPAPLPDIVVDVGKRHTHCIVCRSADKTIPMPTVQIAKREHQAYLCLPICGTHSVGSAIALLDEHARARHVVKLASALVSADGAANASDIAMALRQAIEEYEEEQGA